ncbi:HlyD family efflux transporter periplasmic adaptor subunit [Pelomonas sp. KK5]|uniref:HlyD family efflux transporter periplasmic adaptor subunit n=1 Tax=Pelomonas sp. KK5 TaxID=1855730 RepID=UPI00097BBEA9|nr:HlyD family efflux transporter periplasmic adaptor subunit [Pelomonas sp. KK5]
MASNEPSALTREEGRFVSGLHAATIDEPLPQAVWGLYLMLIIVVVAITWSSIAHVDEITRSDGRIVPDGSEQVIASLESGILRELYVREGQEVEAGQDLAQLDPTRVEATQAEGVGRSLALKAQVARLKAEADGLGSIAFPPEVQASPRIVQAETESFQARRRVLEETVASLDRSTGLLQKELKISQDMSAKGLMSVVEVMRLTRQVNELQAQRTERLARFRQEAAGELVKAQNDLTALDEQMVIRQDAMARTMLKSPVHGVVKAIKVSTVGGVVAAGVPVMEISPIGEQIKIEARVKPGDIGFIHVGQKAQVKLNGYDFNINGGLEGKVTYISPDVVGESAPEKGGNPNNAYYRAVITAEENHLVYKGKPLPVIPGMQAMVEIKTGDRSVLSYLLRPMLKSREALRER